MIVEIINNHLRKANQNDKDKSHYNFLKTDKDEHFSAFFLDYIKHN